MLATVNNDDYDPWKQYQDVTDFMASNETVKQSMGGKSMSQFGGKGKGKKGKGKKKKKGFMASLFGC